MAHLVMIGKIHRGTDQHREDVGHEPQAPLVHHRVFLRRGKLARHILEVHHRRISSNPGAIDLALNRALIGRLVFCLTSVLLSIAGLSRPVP